MAHGFTASPRCGLRMVSLAAAAIALAFSLAPVANAQSASPSFVLQQSTVNSAGADAASTSYRLGGSLGQEVTVGASSAGASYVLQSGFWGFGGAGRVPVVLYVDRNAIATDHVDLDWTGNAAPYDIFRSDDCTRVLQSPFDSTTANSYNAIPPSIAALECYIVLDAPPGP